MYTTPNNAINTPSNQIRQELHSSTSLEQSTNERLANRYPRKMIASLPPLTLAPPSSPPPAPKSHIHKLAFEILGMIFDAIVSFPSDEIDYRIWPEQKGMHIPYEWYNDLSPLKLSMVCREWRRVILHTPRLWRYLRVNTANGMKRVEREKKRIGAYIERSGAVGLEVFYDSFRGVYSSSPLPEELIELLQPSAKRWVGFQARFIGAAHVRQFAPLLEEAHRLETLFLTQLPLNGPPDARTYPDMLLGYVRPFLHEDGGFRNWSFSHLRRFGYNDLEHTSIISCEEFAHLLRSTPLLEKLWISSVDRLSILQDQWGDKNRISLPHLSHLHLHPSAMINTITPELFDVLQVPTLTSLHMNLLDYMPLQETIDLLTAFFRAHANATVQERAAPITTLSMVAARGDSEVLAIMSMLPDVEHVVVWGSVLEGTAQLCKAFGQPIEFPEYLQMNPHLDDDWEFEEMLRMEEEERKAEGENIEVEKSRVHDPATCRECEDPVGENEEDIKKTTHVTLDTSNCILTSQPPPITEQVDERERPALFSRGDEEVKSTMKERQSISISEAKHEHREELELERGSWDGELVVSSRNSTLDRYRHALANANTFTSWMLPRLKTIHFKTTKFYRGENTLLLLQMLKQRQDAARGHFTLDDGRRTMSPAELEGVCLKDIRLCRICRPRFVRLRNELGVGWDKGIARTLCMYMKSEFDSIAFDVDVFFEECHTAWDVTNRAGSCSICP